MESGRLRRRRYFTRTVRAHLVAGYSLIQQVGLKKNIFINIYDYIRMLRAKYILFYKIQFYTFYVGQYKLVYLFIGLL